MSCNCNTRKKERTEAEERALINRLKRIEGQVRGVCAMVEDDAYCPDILTQVAAISSALASFSRELLSEHIRTCAANDIKAEREGAIDELVEVVGRLMR